MVNKKMGFVAIASALASIFWACKVRIDESDAKALSSSKYCVVGSVSAKCSDGSGDAKITQIRAALLKMDNDKDRAWSILQGVEALSVAGCRFQGWGLAFGKPEFLVCSY